MVSWSPRRIASRGGARSWSGLRSAPPRRLEDTMTTEQKIIRAKVGLLELAKQIGNVSQACKMMGYSRDSFYRYVAPGFMLRHEERARDGALFLGLRVT